MHGDIVTHVQIKILSLFYTHEKIVVWSIWSTTSESYSQSKVKFPLYRYMLPLMFD